MNAMITFSTVMLDNLASFLGSTPIIYLFGLVCSCFVVKLIVSLIRC